MQINYSDQPFTGYRIARYTGKTATMYPEPGKPYYASHKDALRVLTACLSEKPSSYSFNRFEIVFEYHGTKRAIPADGGLPPKPAQ